MRVRIVVLEGEVLETKSVNPADLRVDSHGGQGTGFAGELQFGLLEVVRVEMHVPEGVDEVTGLVVENLGDHHGEQGVARDVEGDSEEEVGTALVELAREPRTPSLRLMHVELEKEMAGWEGHLVNLSHVPGRDDVAARVWLVPEVVEEA